MSVLHPVEEEGVAGDGFSGVGARPVHDEFPDPFGALLPAADLDERADDGPDHVAEEAVGADAEVPVFALESLGAVYQ